jgi:hypothetical protein
MAALRVVRDQQPQFGLPRYGQSLDTRRPDEMLWFCPDGRLG